MESLSLAFKLVGWVNPRTSWVVGFVWDSPVGLTICFFALFYFDIPDCVIV